MDLYAFASYGKCHIYSTRILLQVNVSITNSSIGFGKTYCTLHDIHFLTRNKNHILLIFSVDLSYTMGVGKLLSIEYASHLDHLMSLFGFCIHSILFYLKKSICYRDDKWVV